MKILPLKVSTRCPIFGALAIDKQTLGKYIGGQELFTRKQKKNPTLVSMMIPMIRASVPGKPQLFDICAFLFVSLMQDTKLRKYFFFS